MSKIPTVFVAYVTGDDGGFYDEVIAESAEVAQAVAELEFEDYFGNPIKWGDVHPERSLFFRTGTFYEHAHTQRNVIVCERTVWTQDAVNERKAEASGG